MPATGTGPATVPALVNISFNEASRPSLCRSLQMPNNSKMCGGKRATSSMLFEMVLNCKLWNAMSSQTPLLCKVFCSNVGAGCGGRQQALTCARACSACNNVCMSIHADKLEVVNNHTKTQGCVMCCPCSTSLSKTSVWSTALGLLHVCMLVHSWRLADMPLSRCKQIWRGQVPTGAVATVRCRPGCLAHLPHCLPRMPPARQCRLATIPSSVGLSAEKPCLGLANSAQSCLPCVHAQEKLPPQKIVPPRKSKAFVEPSV